MPTEAPVNGVATTLNGAITSGATSLTLTSATGFTNAQYHCLITDGTNYEIVLATALSGTTLTITRAVEAYNGVTTAYGFASGSAISVIASVASVNNLITAAAAAGLALGTASTGVTQSALDNSTKLATDAYADAADAAKAVLIGPQQNGYKAWAFDPNFGDLATTSQFQPTVGTIYYQMIVIPQAFTLANIDFYIQTAGSSPANCYLGIYSAAGTQLAVSANIATTIGTNTGKITCPISYTFTTPGIYWIAILVGTSTTTAPKLASTQSSATTAPSALFNINLANGSGTLATRQATGATSVAVLPAPLTGTPTAVSLGLVWLGLR